MVWVAVDYNNTECVFTMKPSRSPYKTWRVTVYGNYIKLPKGSIKKLIGRELNWSDEPVKLE
jgi:hypothetical protein